MDKDAPLQNKTKQNKTRSSKSAAHEQGPSPGAGGICPGRQRRFSAPKPVAVAGTHLLHERNLKKPMTISTDAKKASTSIRGENP